MTETKFTPGPWRLHPWHDPRPGLNTKSGRYSGIYEPILGCEFGSRSAVLSVGVKGDVDDFWLQISDANARLIAAAPDLYEALRWVRANYAGGSTKEINARIDAALSKALGKEG